MVVKTLEAALAIIIVLSSIVFLFPVDSIKQQNPYSAYDCLRHMDQEGSLRYYASNLLASEIKSNLRGCIPVSLNYSIGICMSSDCSTPAPSDRAVFLTSYMISGSDEFSPALINVWMWSK